MGFRDELEMGGPGSEKSRATNLILICTGKELDWREKSLNVALGIFSLMSLRDIQMKVLSSWTYCSGLSVEVWARETNQQS